MADDDLRGPEENIAPPIAPPVIGYATPEKKSTWPTVIGILGIVLGILGILGGILGVLSYFLTGAFLSVVPEEQSRIILDFQKSWILWTILMQILVIGAAIYLLIAGLGVMKERSGSDRRMRIWAAIKIAVVAVNTGIGSVMQREMLAAQMESDPQVANTMAQFGNIFAWAGLCFGVVWGWAFPIFVLIWFARRKIKAETAEWS